MPKLTEREREGFENRDASAIDNSEIPLGIADAKIGKDLVTEFVGYQPQKLVAEVRKLPEMLK